MTESAHKTTAIVGRDVELEILRQSLYRNDDRNVIVLVRGQGGLGKTRLLQETLWRSGNFRARQQRKITDSEKESGLDWTMHGNTAVSNLIDMIDARLHARNDLLRRIYYSLQWPGGADLSQYDRSYERFKRLRVTGAEFQQVREAADMAVDGFIDNLRKVTKKQRVAWVFDTVEQLGLVSSEWLLDHKLLRPQEDMATRSHRWLVNLIADHKLKNMTMIMAGRPGDGEAKAFFDDIEAAVEEANQINPGCCLLRIIDISPLSRDETRQYFVTLANEQRSSFVRNQFEALADQAHEDYRVLHLYTNGIPVRLALYTQIVLEGWEVPELLQQDFATAKQRSEDAGQLEIDQWGIEDHFIDFIFRNPTNLRLQILQALVRAPRGLTAAQLHFVLDNVHELPAAKWVPNPHRQAEIAKTLEEMKKFYLVKERDFQTIADRENKSLRLGLQDEIYRIYAEHMAPLSMPKPLAKHIAETFDERDHERYELNREDEVEERQILYRALRDWAEYQQDLAIQEKADYLADDEGRFERDLSPSDPRTFKFQDLSDEELSRRDAIQESILSFEVEAMVYALLLDPEENFNRAYTDLADSMYKAQKEDADFLIQTEMWRVLHDDYALKFVDFRNRTLAEERGETPFQVLRRAAQQENVARWLKRFVILKQYERAIEFGKAVDWAVEGMQYDEKSSESDWLSWRHTLVREERQTWRAYANILAHQRVPDAIDDLLLAIGKLQKLIEASTDEVALVNDGYEENGFDGDLSQNIPPHPALIRLRRVLSFAFNTLGYAYIIQGQIRNAVSSYSAALYFLHETGAVAQRATILNNLSKALSDLGRRSERMCLDALNLRRKLGEEIPIAYSYNTLALIYDDQNRPEDAWVQSAKAVAYFRRAIEARGLGMGLLQLGEALRHIASQVRSGKTFIADENSLLTTARQLLKEAEPMFISAGLDNEDSAPTEPYRYTEIVIEIGCLHRDLMLGTHDEQELQKQYTLALTQLERGRQLAKTYKFDRFSIDSLVNMAWAHYYAQRYDDANDAIERAHAKLQQLGNENGEVYLIQSSMPDASSTNNVWAFDQLSKMYALKGRIALERFRRTADQVGAEIVGEDESSRRQRHQVVQDSKLAQSHLVDAIKAYSHGIDYAMLFSTDAPAVIDMQDNLYSYLRRFNFYEVQSFYNHLNEWMTQGTAAEYAHRLQGPAVIKRFLHEFMSIPVQ